MKINIGFDQIDVDGITFRAWFPRLLYTSWSNGDDLVNDLADRIDGRFGIKQHHIERTLVGFFEGLGLHSGSLEGQTQMRVVGVLMAQLKHDKQDAWNAKGLRGSRNMFVILAYLASEGHSIQLAQALHDFWWRGSQCLMQESPKYHGHWHKAIEKIQELIERPPTLDLGAFAMIPYAGLHHRRSPRALALAWPGHRARSLPAIRRRHNPDMRLAIPRHPSSAWSSPMISPVGYSRSDYFEELGNLQYQQSEMSMKLDNVDGKLDLLLAAYY